MDYGLKTRGIKYLNVGTWLLFAPLSRFLATRLAEANLALHTFTDAFILRLW